MNCPNCASDMESNACLGVRASEKATHMCSECGYSETR